MRISTKLYLLILVVVVMFAEPALERLLEVSIGDSPVYTLFISLISYFLMPKEADDENKKFNP